MAAARAGSPSRRLSVANAMQIEAYGQLTSPPELRRRILRTLKRRVLTPATAELREYFETVIEQISSAFGSAGENDAISASSDEDLEQTALLFCHYDIDGDGLLTRDEFSSIAELVAGHTGQSFTPEHIDRCFRNADVDANGVLDLNELLLYAQQRKKNKKTGR